jgi:uncharacterized protein YndB with AHSA1/START domain
MSQSKPLQIHARGETEIEISRGFKAPRELVFDAWSKPELVRRWLLGPPGWTMPVCEIDFRVGGGYRFVWRNAEGQDMGMRGRYVEIARPERIVSAEIFDVDWTGGETISTLSFTAEAGGTRMVQVVKYASLAARDGALHSGMAEGMEFGYARLEDLLGEARA